MPPRVSAWAAKRRIFVRAGLGKSAVPRSRWVGGRSHDLRTILTRFKLELALIGDSPELDGMRKDVDEMAAMLEAYLSFARGDSGEQGTHTDMAPEPEEVRGCAERNER